ncbi:hypothetical protein NQ314_017614 [Rhamnusium bicolor]|uniref:Uncharacterized protein n=1 Tax=Rhamnusium bicolor TaxID=1586634 RepID=A0AAV8WSY7_9CUCU|nr:hypothetical protein NQ314_017614 [Rhamnusium bicolor]
MEDLETRHMYLKNNLNDLHLVNFVDKLYEVLHKLKYTENKCLPLDYRWIPETPYKIKNSLQSNKLNLALHITSNYFKEELELNTIKSRSLLQKEVTLLDYMQEKQRRKVEDKFNDLIVNEYLCLIKRFDDYLNNIPEQIENVTDEEVLKILHLISWRFAFHKCTLSDIKKINATEQYNILINLTVHYKWFFKYAIKEISSVTKVDLPKDLKEQVDNINCKLEAQFSFMQKIGKNFQKCSNNPPPYINEHQLEVVPAYNKISHCYNLCDKRNDLINVVNILNADKDLRQLLVEMKSKLDYDFSDASKELVLLKSLHEAHQNTGIKETLSEFETHLLPIIDYLTHLTIKGIMRTIPKIEISSMVTNSILVPTDLSGALLCYNRTKDIRLLHEITKAYYLYLMNSACVKPVKYLKGNEDDNKEIVLSNFSPKLTFYLSYLHNEKEYVLRIFKIFIIQFATSLNIEDTNGKTLQQITSKCIETLRQLSQSSSLADPNNDTPKFIKHLQMCSVTITKLSNSSDINNTLLLISDLYMELSYIKATFNSKLSVIDPLAKKALKKEYCLKAIDTFKNMKRCYELQNELYSNTDQTIHAYYAPIKQIISELEVKDEELGKYVAVRSKDVMYETVLRVVNHAFATILSENYVNKTSCALSYHILNVIDAISRKEDIDYRYFVAQLNQHESTVSSYENLIHEWNQLCNTYPDIIEPLLSNVVEFLYGLKMKLSLLRKVIAEYENMKLDINVKEDLLNLVKLPVLDESQNSYCKHIEMMTSKRINTFVSQILENEEFPHVKDLENFRLLKCGIRESFNLCIIDAKHTDNLNKNSFMKFNELMDLFISAWNKQQEEKEIQEIEADSLYKTRTKCDDKPEEEQIEEELNELFPNYHGIDFPDLQKKFRPK